MAATGKRFKAGQFVNLLREIDVMTANCKSLLEACQQAGISYKSYYRWCKIYGGLKVDHARKFKEIETEGASLKKLVAELSLREAMIKEVRPGKLLSPARHKAAAKMLMERYLASGRKACAYGRYGYRMIVGLSDEKSTDVARKMSEYCQKQEVDK